MKFFKQSAAAAVIALGTGLMFVPQSVQAGESTGTWANGAVAGPNGRVHTPYRQGYRNYHNGPRYGYRPAPRGYYYRGIDPGAAAAAGIVGLATGAIVGGALSQNAAPTYGAAPAYGNDAVQYCMNRFRSYDPGSGTYLGNDGYRHACP